jgi:hypothetical protein
MPRRLLRAALLASALASLSVGSAAAAPDNDNTLRFVLTCDDGRVWDASFNGGPAAFHLDGGGLYIWKQIDFVTPAGDSGSVEHGIQGFSGAPVVVCTYTGAVSGNAYTVTGFYPTNR